MTVSQLTSLTGRKPTSSTSETKVNVAAGSMPWQTESSKGDEAREHFKVRIQIHLSSDFLVYPTTLRISIPVSICAALKKVAIDLST
jgi:hypothetical protein